MTRAIVNTRTYRMLGAIALELIGLWGCAGSPADVPDEPLPPVVVRTEPASVAQCPYGGSVVSSGLDRIRNGVLDDVEIVTRSIVCNPAPAMQPPRLVVRVIAEPPGPNCSAGGTAVQSGPDDNSNGSLDDAEVSHVDYLCRQPLLTRLATEPAGPNCIAGGVAFFIGRDRDGDGALADAEIERTEYECGDVLSRDVVLSSDDDVAALANIRIITGSLTDTAAFRVTSIALPNLIHVGGSLRIEASLTHLELPALQEVGGDFILRFVRLPAVDFRRLGRVGSFELESMGVSDLSGFAALTEVDRNFSIGSSSLVSADLPRTSIGGSVRVSLNSQLTRITGVLADEVESLSISSNPVLESVDLSVTPRNRATSHLGPTSFFSNDTLARIALSAEQVGALSVSDNPLVGDIALDVAKFEHTLFVRGIAVPFRLALSTPRTGGEIEFGDDFIITSPLAAMESTAPVIVDGLCVFDKTLLHTLDAGARLTLARGGVRFSDNTLLTGVAPFTLDGTLQLINNAVLETAGFLSLATPGEIGGMAITDNPRLASVPSLDAVVRIRGDVGIARNPSLVSVFGPSLVQVDGQLFIDDNDSLAHLDFPLLESVIFAVVVSGNAALQTIQMPALTDADDELIIRTNPQLRHIAFDALEHATTFLVLDNPRLPTCEVLPLFAQVRSIGHSQSGNDDSATCLR